MKDTDNNLPTKKIRVTGADEPHDPVEVLKAQFQNFSNLN